MSGANGIDAKLFESFEATLPCAQRDCRAESTGVRVQADTFELEIFSVEPEACVGVEMKFADTESGRLVVKRVAASSTDTRDGAIEIRMIQLPKLWRLDDDVLLKVRRTFGCDWLRLSL